MYIFLAASVFTVVSILMGAFAHHALQSVLTPKELQSISVASRYLFYNSVPLLFLFFTKDKWQWPTYLSICFIVSSILFSGSIYLLVFTKIKSLAFFTPIGGIGIMISWGLWAFEVKRKVQFDSLQGDGIRVLNMAFHSLIPPDILNRDVKPNWFMY